MKSDIERIKENQRRYRDKNRAKIRIREKLKRERKKAENPEFYKNYTAQYHLRRKTDARAVAVSCMYRMQKRAFEKGWTFDLSEHLEELVERVGRWRCELSGVPLEVHVAKKKINSLSIDRIDSMKGYTIDNVRVVAWGLNAAFSDWGEAETVRLMRRYLDRLDLI